MSEFLFKNKFQYTFLENSISFICFFYRYDASMTDRQVTALMIRALTYSTINDWHTGGDLNVSNKE